MKYLEFLVLVIAVLLLTSCADRDLSYEELSEAEIEMHLQKVNEMEPAAGNISILRELMKPRASVLDFLE